MIKIIKKYSRMSLTILLLLMIAGTMFLYFNVPGESKIFLPCFFHYITNLYCPGCGSTRLLYSLIHGDIVTALKCNILVLIFIPILFYSFIVLCVNIYLKKQVLRPINFTPAISRAIIIIVIIFTIFRNIPFVPFSYLAPISLV